MYYFLAIWTAFVAVVIVENLKVVNLASR